ncbi:O-antigen ligase family protein [Algoriphagus sp.]|uniref:O-antigen ligase family protein n=1 Tax=Algoriphagus sp. TaxID=1872435 RepID=UPI0026223469|nr:O-antigen ligase family protein [Algoriphagus sp.]
MFNPFEAKQDIFLSSVILYLYNFIAVIVFALYWERIDQKWIKYFFLISGFILWSSLVLQFLGFEQLPFQGEIKGGMEEEESVLGVRFGGYAQDQNYATFGMVIWGMMSMIFFKNMLKQIVVFLAATGIIISFSKTIILVLIFLFFYYLFSKVKLHFVYVAAIILSVSILMVSIFDVLMSLSTVYNRFLMWRAAFEGFIENPILGSGITSVRSNYLYRGGWYVQPHNSYIALLFDNGIISFVLYLVILVRSFRIENRLYRYLIMIFIAFSFSQELFVFQYPYSILGVIPIILNCCYYQIKLTRLEIREKQEDYIPG